MGKNEKSGQSVVRPTILIVDDTPTNLYVLTTILTKQGYHVQPATQGEAALQKAQAEPPDLILLDIMMPEMDGYEVCRHLKENPQTSEIPVIFLSALDKDQDKAKAFEVGGIDYIPKPFQRQEVILRIENQLQLQRAKQQLQAQNQQLEIFSTHLKVLHRLHTTVYDRVEDLCADYLQTGCQVLGLSTGIISHIQGNVYKIKAVKSDIEGLEADLEFDLNLTYCIHSVQSQKTITCASSPYPPLFFPNNRQVEAYITTPIWVNDKIYGTVCFCAAKAKEEGFQDREREIVELMAQSLGKYLTADENERKRKEAEARFRAIFENATIGIGVVGESNAFIDTNPALQSFLGYNSEELQQRGFQDIIHPFDFPFVQEQFQALQTGQKDAFQDEQRYIRENGQIVWGRLKVCAVKEAGKIQFTFGLVEDITQRKQAEEATQLLLNVTQAISEAYDFESALQVALEEVGEASGWNYGEVWLPNLNGTMLECSPAWYYSDSTAQDKTTQRAIQQFRQESQKFTFARHEGLPGKVWAQAEARYLPSLSSISDFQLARQELAAECKIKACLGVPILSPPTYGLDSSSPSQVLAVLVFFLFEEPSLKTYSEEEGLAALVSSVATQLGTVMQQKQTEAELKALFAAMDEQVLLLDSAGRCLKVSPTRTVTLMSPVAEMVGKTLWEILPLKTANLLFEAIQDTLTTRQTHQIEYGIQLQSKAIWLDARLSPLTLDTVVLVARDISDRVIAELELQKLAEELEQRVQNRTVELEEAKEQLQTVLDAVPGFIAWIGQENPDSELRYLGVNRLLGQFYNLPPSAFVGQSLGFLPSGFLFQDFVKVFFKSSLSDTAEVITLQVNDQQRHYLVVAQKYHENRETVVVGVDITARVQAEEQQQQAYQRLQLLSQLTLKIRQSLDLEEILQTTVVEVHKLLKADQVCLVQQEIPQQNIVIQEAGSSNLPPLESQLLWNLYSEYGEVLEKGNYLAMPDLSQVKSPSEAVLCLLSLGIRGVVIVPIFIQAKVWGYIIVHQCFGIRHWKTEEMELLTSLADQIGIAVSQAQLLHHLEERVAERTVELQQTNQKLEKEVRDRILAESASRRSETQLRLITDALPVLISYVDREERYQFNNQTYEEWLEKPLNQITGCRVKDVMGDFYEVLKPYMKKALDGEKVTFETETPPMNGKKRYINLSYIPDFDIQGQVKGYFCTVIDISERKAIEQMKDEFIAIASHELRTPLTSIRGSLGLLATGRLGELSDKGQRMLEIAVSNTDRLHRLINDILDLERIESGKITLTQQPCNACDLIMRATEAMQSMADSAQVNLILEENEPITVYADPDSIQQTLTNLISNAIKFSYPSGIVNVGVISQSEQALFYVQDYGRGIPSDKLEAIFGRFQQVDASDSREKGGTGLGLPICREIIQRHGGEIWVESELGQGSRFYFTLRLSKQ